MTASTKRWKEGDTLESLKAELNKQVDIPRVLLHSSAAAYGRVRLEQAMQTEGISWYMCEDSIRELSIPNEETREANEFLLGMVKNGTIQKVHWAFRQLLDASGEASSDPALRGGALMLVGHLSVASLLICEIADQEHNKLIKWNNWKPLETREMAVYSIRDVRLPNYAASLETRGVERQSPGALGGGQHLVLSVPDGPDQEIPWDSLHPVEHLSTGEEAWFARCDQYPGKLFKIYHDNRKVTYSLKRKLEKLCRVRVAGAALPEGIIKTKVGGKLIGVMVPEMNGVSFAHTEMRCKPRAFRIQMIKEVCYTVARLHMENILVNDLCPENILITPDRGPVLVDLDSVHYQNFYSGVAPHPTYCRPTSWDEKKMDRVNGHQLSSFYYKQDLYALAAMLFLFDLNTDRIMDEEGNFLLGSRSRRKQLISNGYGELVESWTSCTDLQKEMYMAVFKYKRPCSIGEILMTIDSICPTEQLIKGDRNV